MSATSPSSATLDLEEQIGRIRRAREESEKFSAEQRKLTEEALKFAAERRKYDRERWVPIAALISSLVAAIGALIAAGKSLGWF